MLWTDKAQKYLKKYWKIEKLKDKQFNVINELLLGNDVIGLLPTGYGKSLCYLLPPLVTKKIMFIISPLISLMDDQKEKLVSMGIPCATLHGNNKNKDQESKNKIELVANVTPTIDCYIVFLSFQLFIIPTSIRTCFHLISHTFPLLLQSHTTHQCSRLTVR
jgi:superfamily II DNA helicase RecQ